MAGLGETTARLKRARRDVAITGTGASKLKEYPDFGANPGELRMHLYVPKDLPAGAPLVVVLHGCTQGADEFARQSGWLGLADQLGFAVLAPEQRAANNLNRCFNWFQDGDIRRGQGEAASIAQMVAYVGRTSGQGRGLAFVTGLSAGGAMTAVMLATYPELFAAGAVIAGLPYDVAHGVPDAMRAMSWRGDRDSADLADRVRRAAPATRIAPRLSIWHGAADGVVNPANAVDLAGQWAIAGGLQAEADSAVTEGPVTRSIWRDPLGDVAIELNLVRGLGHGVPLATSGPDGLGVAAPHMLEAGVSSSREIARFWGLDRGASPLASGVARPEPKVRRPAPGPAPRAAEQGVAEQVLGVIRRNVPSDVEQVITNAFKAAGLMR